MSSLKALSLNRRDVFYIDVDLLEIIPGFNIRHQSNFGDLDQLARTIRSEGVQEAFHGYKTDKDKFAVTQGHRREAGLRRAITLIEEDIRLARVDDDRKRVAELNKEMAKVRSVPVISEPQGKSDTDRLYDQFTLNDGLALTILDQAEGFRRLMEKGESEATIIRRRGITKTHFANCMLLLNDAAPKVLDFVRQGRVSSTLAIELVRKVKDKTEQVRLLEEAAGKVKEAGSKISAKHLDETVRQQVQPSKPSKKKNGAAASTAGELPSSGAGGRTGGATAAGSRKATIEKTEDPFEVPLGKTCGVEARVATARLSNGMWVVGVQVRYSGAKDFSGSEPVIDNDQFPSQAKAELEGILIVKDNVLAAERTAGKDFSKKVKFDKVIEQLDTMLDHRKKALEPAPSTSTGKGSGSSAAASDVPSDSTHDADEESLVPADTAEQVRHILALRDTLKGDKRMKKRLGAAPFVTLNFIADYLEGGRYQPAQFEKFFTQFVISGKQ